MSKIDQQIKDIESESSNRIMEINYMFSQLSSFDSRFLDDYGSIDTKFINEDGSSCFNILDKYFLSRSIVVFSYATLERFVKCLSQHALTAILDNKYFQNNVKELMSILKFSNKPSDLFELIMHYKSNPISEHNLGYNSDKGYFSKRDRIDAKAIAHVRNVLDLDRNEPILKIPALTIDNLSKNRMKLAHGDYMSELKQFNISRQNIKIEDINDYIENTFKLNETTRNDLVQFISDFKEKIISLLYEIENYNKLTVDS